MANFAKVFPKFSLFSLSEVRFYLLYSIPTLVS